MTNELKVEEGQVLISSITLMHNTPDLQVYYVDCQSKYPEWMGGGGELLLYAGERTLRANREVDKPTRITFPDPGPDFVSFVDGGRYSVFHIRVRLNHGEEVWRSPERRNIHDAIDAWHESVEEQGGSKPIYEHLGMSAEDYARWVEGKMTQVELHKLGWYEG